MSSDVGVPDGTTELADRVALAVEDVVGVDSLHPGALGEVATYLPGRRVGGVRLRGDDCEVHVVMTWGAAVQPVTDAVRAAVRPLVAGRVDVTVADVASPAGP